jgi:hypothetical protein
MTTKPPDLTHAYDDPSINSMDFLLAIMRDHSVALAIRMDAAAKLLPLYREPPQTVYIKITGGLQLTPEELAAIKARNQDVFAWDAKVASSNRTSSVH